MALWLSALLFAAGCSSGARYDLTAAPDYSLAAMWFDAPADTSASVDVFYIAPTCIWDWQDQDGRTYHHMDTDNPKQRDRVDGSLRLAHALFGRHGRFYAPYYRQVTMESWTVAPDETERRYALAHQDVVRAFDYYMTHCNAGRPFILAGHSQGAKAVIELLKHTLTPQQHERMVAAYAFGYAVGRQELERYPLLRPARDSLDCGVLICYNSVSAPEAVSPLLGGNAVCINPLNWRTDTTYAPAGRHLGAVFFDAEGGTDTLRHRIGARIDEATRTLIVDGLDDEDYYIPSIGELFPKGNYHVQELNLYFLNVQRNLEQRIAAFRSE
ncbi:Protein of uncharacterised function (DUF3089) [Alistipes sp. cv1]|nr:Protein of uncharacterised function (DUF3089) [Faecalibacterium prausnitzii]